MESLIISEKNNFPIQQVNRECVIRREGCDEQLTIVLAIFSGPDHTHLVLSETRFSAGLNEIQLRSGAFQGSGL